MDENILRDNSKEGLREPPSEVRQVHFRVAGKLKQERDGGRSTVYCKAMYVMLILIVVVVEVVFETESHVYNRAHEPNVTYSKASTKQVTASSNSPKQKELHLKYSAPFKIPNQFLYSFVS